jgi:hypothetical protein
MAKKMIWVAALSGTYGLNGVYYGPSKKPLQIPDDLAQTLGLDEIEAPELSPVEALTAGLAAGVSEELEKTKETLKVIAKEKQQLVNYITDLIVATNTQTAEEAWIAFSIALTKANNLDKVANKLENQDGYILDLITMSGANNQETAKVAIATAISQAKKLPELEQVFTTAANASTVEISSLKETLEKAKADTKVLKDFITELQETAKVATPADIKAVLEAKSSETAKAKKA